MESEPRPSPGDRHKIDHLYAALKHVTRFGLALDVGAHHGIYTQLLAGRFDHVIAYEPHPENFIHLLRNVQKSGNVEPLRAAVVDESTADDVALWRRTKVNPANTQGCYVARMGEVLVAEEIPLVRLDAASMMLPVDFLKIDVEGGELAVLRGARQTIEKDGPVIMVEIAERHLRRHGGTDPETLRGWLVKRGYTLRETMREDHVYVRH